MAQTFFISVQYVKDNSIVDENVDEKYIRIAIQKAQKNFILYLIGTGIYNELASQIQNNTLTSLNTTLLDSYIAPCLLSYTLVELSPFLLYKLSNRNLGVKEADKVTAADWATMDKVMERFENDAQLEAKKLRNYIIENQTLYPLYNSPGTGIDVIYPKSDTFEQSIWLGGRYNNNNISRIDRAEYPGTYGCEE